MGGSLNNPIFRWGGFPKIQLIGGNFLKRGAWTVSRFKGGGAWQKRGRGIFEGVGEGWLIFP